VGFAGAVLCIIMDGQANRVQLFTHWFMTGDMGQSIRCATAGMLRQASAHTVLTHTAFCVGMRGYVLRLGCEIQLQLTGQRG
jgi:hypothetical protein